MPYFIQSNLVEGHFKWYCAISKNFPKLTKSVVFSHSADQNSALVATNVPTRKAQICNHQHRQTDLQQSSQDQTLMEFLFNFYWIRTEENICTDSWSKEQSFKDWLNLRNTLFSFSLLQILTSKRYEPELNLS